MRRANLVVLGAVLLLSCQDSSRTESASSTSAAAAAAPATSAAVAPSASAVAPEPSAVPSASASAARPPSQCPPATSPDRVAAFDWGKELSVEAPLAARLRGVSGAAVEAQLLANQIDLELRQACTTLAGDLGTRRVFTSAPLACQAAVDALRTARAALGPTAKVVVNVHPALCPAAMGALQECAKRCNGDDSAQVTCAGTTMGRCPGTCDGPCEMRAPGQCDGACAGRCEGVFSGPCDGTCKGTCNDVEMKQPGACKGTCEGSCDGLVKGPCKGTCKGGCQLKAATCAGTCAGKCSVAVEDPKCGGAVKIGRSAECAAYCEIRAAHRATCGAAQVDAHVDGAKDPKAKGAYEAAIEKSLPQILKIEAQLRDRMATIGKTKATVTAGLKAITDSNSAALPSLSPCLFGYDKASVEGTDGVLASFRAAVETAGAARAK